MGLPSNTNALQNGFAQGYQIGRSLRFRNSASAYLSRTFGSNGSQQTWTWSGWVKAGRFGSQQPLFCAYSNTTNYGLFAFSANAFISATDTLKFYTAVSNVGQAQLETAAVFRDPSAWYHILLQVDTTQATANNRVRIYVNGVQQTLTGTQPSQNTNLGFYNTTSVPQQIGALASGTYGYFDGYMAEINFIDGQSLSPSSFGVYDSNGIWQPIKYTGTYGTNGFYLPFSNTTSTTTLVADASGNGNNWTANNISLTSGTTYDSMIDSPTVSSVSSNYAVLNPLQKSSGITLSNANLTAYSDAQGNCVRGTIAISSGKWYWEAVQTAQGSAATNNCINGIMLFSEANNQIGVSSTSYGYVDNGNKINNNTQTAYGATYGLNDVMGIALDLDGGTITFYKNNVSQGTAFTGLSGTFMPAIGDRGGGVSKEPTWAINFGQRPFTYTPPSGYNALNTANLPQPLISNGANYMAATTYTGTGSNITITNSQSNGGNNAANRTFYPDFVWTKGRSAATNNILIDSVRGGANYLISDSTSAEVNNAAAAIQSFSSTGYVMGTGGAVNTNGATYVGWQWNAGSGSSSSNTSGSITSTVSANTTAGFSVVTWTAGGAGTTIGHGLGVAPNMIIVKDRSVSADWCVYTTTTGAGAFLKLNSTAASAADTTMWGNTTPTSTTFKWGYSTGDSMVAYCFSAVRGYSAFGSYTGNGSTDGPFIYTGFRPRLILTKCSSNSTSSTVWTIWDTSRNTYNASVNELYPNSSGAEFVDSSGIDILSNGFKPKRNSEYANFSGWTYVYAAFAENPFNYSRAR